MIRRDTERESRLSTKLRATRFAKLQLRPFCLKSVASTQDYISELQDSSEGYFVVSEVQTEGRGRKGDKWISDVGGLYLSLELEPLARISERMTSMCTDSILQTLSGNYHLSGCEIKEPNDVICNGKKVAGVLIDAVVLGEKIVAYAGMGVNLNNGLAWKEYIQEIATSFRRETGKMVDQDEFLVALLANLDRKYAALTS